MAKTDANGDTAQPMRVDTALVRELAELLNANELTEIEVEDGGRKIKVKREAAAVPGFAAAPAYAPAFAPPPGPRRRGQSAPQYAELEYYSGLPYTREPVPPLDQWPLARIVSGRSRSQPQEASSVPLPARFDRLQLSSWAMLRQRPGQASLGTNGMLGGSQAGMRLSYRFDPRFAVGLRTSVPLGTATRGGEAALGLRYQPFAAIPVSLTAERRQAFGKGGGRSAFALFAEGGLYHRPVFNKIYLDGYVQGGVVGARRRDLFIDGGATLTRPIWRNFSAGIGVWGAAQTGLYRLDIGPRLTMDVRRGIKVHADYRKRLVGNAAPQSGPALTLAADF